MEYPQIKRVIEVVKKIRDPKGGCPWDLAQTHQSLLSYLIEESYEYKYAVESGDTVEMEKELGDVFFQVLLHSQIASESDVFNLEGVAKKLADKMIYRHPHVFKENQGTLTQEDVIRSWNKLKSKETEKSNKPKPFFKKEDLCMPALMSSQKIGKKSAEVNFDWKHYSHVMDKVQEEWDEVKQEVKIGPLNKERIKDEIGDLLFSVTQLARHLDIDAEDALHGSNKKFIKRFTQLESFLKADKQDIMSMSTTQLEEYWSKVKKFQENS